ncbi:hypothetical protein LIER_07214 [Lithospermum erythrorhizon]|uniref:Uncharacterized protein n=1 Tax=Lithospermum erythrorhizon TaxID=34254 RepID=A0AAV3P7N5_LITER
MEPNGSNDNRPPENDGLKLNNPFDRPQEDAPTHAQGPVNLMSGGTMPEEATPQLRGENPVEVSSVREDRVKTYTHTPLVRKGNEPVSGQQNRHDGPTPEAIAPESPTDVVEASQRQVDALSARVAKQVRRGTNTEMACLAPFSPDIRRGLLQDRLAKGQFLFAPLGRSEKAEGGERGEDGVPEASDNLSRECTPRDKG